MTCQMRPQEFANVVNLAPQERYRYFIKKVADSEEVWSLWNEGWAMLGDNHKSKLMAVWPPRFCEGVCHRRVERTQRPAH